MGRRAAPSQRVVAVQEHAASRAIVPESALPFGGPSLPGAPEYKAPAWWPDDGEEYLISVAADTFDGDWEWVQSPRQQLSSPDSHPARQDSESEAGSPAESASLDLDKLGNDLAELYAIVCKTPPQCVKQVLAAVCIALCVSPQQSAGNRRGSYFAAGRELLHDSSNLLLRLSTFDPEELLADTARRRALEDAVGKISVSRVRMAACSAAGLAQWVHNAVSRVGAAEQRAVARRTTAATSRTEYSGLPGAGGAAGVAVSCHTRTNVGAHYGLQRGPPWSPWDDETSDPEHHRLRKTSEDYCGWDVDGAPIGRRQPPKRYSASDAKAAARQAQAELLGVDVPTISVSQADYQQHAPTAKLRTKTPLDLTILHLGSPTAHTFRGTTEFKDGLCGPGSAAWAAQTGRPAGLPLKTRGALGVQILGGAFHELIPGGAELPIEASQRFSLSHAHQQEVCIVVLEAASEPAGQPIPASTALGEGRPVSTKLLTTLDLVGLPPLTPGSSISTGRGRPAVR